MELRVFADRTSERIELIAEQTVPRNCSNRLSQALI